MISVISPHLINSYIDAALYDYTELMEEQILDDMTADTYINQTYPYVVV